MLQREFEERTKVKVSAEEFAKIHDFYMSCELDKDEFCKMWCKMNKNRIKAERDAKKAEKELSKKREKLEKFSRKYRKVHETMCKMVGWNSIFIPAYGILDPEAYDLVTSLGLDMNKDILHIIFKIENILHDEELLKELSF